MRVGSPSHPGKHGVEDDRDDDEDSSARQMQNALRQQDAESLRTILSAMQYDGVSPLQCCAISTGDKDLSKCSAIDGVVTFSPLKQVLRNRDALSLGVLLDYGCETILDVTSPSHAFSAVHYVCATGNPECLEVLLQHGTDPNLLFGKPFLTPLHTLIGAWHNFRTTRSPMVDPHYHHNHLSESRFVKCLRLLIRYKAESSRKDSLGQDAVHLACSKGLLPAVQILLTEGSTKWKLQSGCYTCLHAAIDGLSLEVVKFLFDTASQYRTVTRKTLLHLRDGNGNTPLHTCARVATPHRQDAGNVARFLLKQGADPNIRNYQGDTPLLLVLQNWHAGKQDVFAALMESDCNCLLSESSAYRATASIPREKILVEATLQHERAIRCRQLIPRCHLRQTIACAQHATSWSPLHYAAFYGNTEHVADLLRRGANVNATDGRGRTPLFMVGLRLYARAHRTGGLDVVARLVQSHDPLPLDGEDLSIANNFEIVKTVGEENSRTLVSLLIAQDACLTCLDVDGNLPFSYACAVARKT